MEKPRLISLSQAGDFKRSTKKLTGQQNLISELFAESEFDDTTNSPPHAPKSDLCMQFSHDRFAAFLYRWLIIID